MSDQLPESERVVQEYYNNKNNEDKIGNPEEQPIAEKEAYNYVKKHNFDSDIRDICWASYHDGYVGGMKEHTAQTLDSLKGEIRSKRTTNFDEMATLDTTSRLYKDLECHNRSLKWVLKLIEEVSDG